MFYIILLIVLGLLFLVAEIVLLPGVSVGALLALVCDGSAIYLAFRYHDTPTGIVVVVLIVILSLVATILSLRAKTWQRFSLRQKIDSSSMPSPQTRLRVGERGVTLSRLSPWAGSKSEANSTRPSRSMPTSTPEPRSRWSASRTSASSSNQSQNNNRKTPL